MLPLILHRRYCESCPDAVLSTAKFNMNQGMLAFRPFKCSPGSTRHHFYCSFVLLSICNWLCLYTKLATAFVLPSSTGGRHGSKSIYHTSSYGGECPSKYKGKLSHELATLGRLGDFSVGLMRKLLLILLLRHRFKKGLQCKLGDF